MKKLSGKIILVDDEPFEEDLLRKGLEKLHFKTELKVFRNAIDALHFLKKTDDEVFMIISDMNMPKMNGLDFKKAIDADDSLRQKSVPFIFSSTTATRAQLLEAYEYRLQGYFIKPADAFSMAKQMSLIIEYWVASVRPDNYNN